MLSYLKKFVAGSIPEEEEEEVGGAALTKTGSSGSSGASPPLAQMPAFMSDSYQQQAYDGGYGPPADFPYSYGDSPRHEFMSTEICKIILDEQKDPTSPVAEPAAESDSSPDSEPAAEPAAAAGEEEEDLIVAVVITIFQGSSYDELFRQYKQLAEPGTQVAVYQCPFYYLPDLIPALHEAERQRLRAQAYSFAMGKHARLGADSAVRMLLDEEPTLMMQIFAFLAPEKPR
jgi:hypothetical protein